MSDKFEAAAQQEYQQSFITIGKLKSSINALKKSYSRFDNLIARATEESLEKPACRAGCAYCCHYKVEVKAHEMFLIHEHMQKSFEINTIETILSKATANAELIRTLTPKQHLATNIACPMLIENQCSIYTVRPFRCRSFHALDVAGCADSFTNPTDFSITTDLIEGISLYSNAVSQGFEAAATHAGLDNRTYDFNTALLEAFSDPKAAKRYHKGKKAFNIAIEVLDTDEE